MTDRIDVKDLINRLDEYNHKRLFELNKNLNKFVYNNFELIKKLRDEKGESWENMFNFFQVYFVGNEEVMRELNDIKTSRKLSGLYQACENYFNKNKQAKQKRTKTVGEKNESN